MSHIRRRDWISLYIRSFYLQAAWNYESMQALGFAAALAPILARVCRGTEEKVAFLRRHLEFFNAHPYFASFVLGATVHLEEKHEAGVEESVRWVKKTLYGPLGSLGDQMFWSGLLPMVGLIGAIMVLAGLSWGPLLFLLMYNVPHLWIRYLGLERGYELGVEVYQALVHPLYKKSIEAIQWGGAFAVGVYISTRAVVSADMHINRLILFVLCIILCWVAIRRRLSLYVLGLGAVAAGLASMLVMNG